MAEISADEKQEWSKEIVVSFYCFPSAETPDGGFILFSYLQLVERSRIPESVFQPAYFFVNIPAFLPVLAVLNMTCAFVRRVAPIRMMSIGISDFIFF